MEHQPAQPDSIGMQHCRHVFLIAQVVVGTGGGGGGTGVPQGIGDELLDKAIKSASFWLQGGSTPTGTVYCRIWDQANIPVATLGSVNASTINTTDFQKITFTNTSNELKMKDQVCCGC